MLPSSCNNFDLFYTGPDSYDKLKADDTYTNLHVGSDLAETSTLIEEECNGIVHYNYI